MASEKDEPQTREKKDPKLELRDLKPKKDAKGGGKDSKSDERRTPGTKGEVDFMNWD